MPGYVQVAIDEPGYGSTSPNTCSFGSSVTVGNIIYVVFVAQGAAGALTAGTVTDNKGNTYTLCAGSTLYNAGLATQLWCYWTQVTTGGSGLIVSAPWTGSNGYTGTYAFELSGVSAFDAANTGSGSTANPSVTVTTTQAASEIIVMAGINNGSSTNHGAGCTLIQITSGYSDCLEYRLATGPGAFAMPVVAASPGSWGYVAAAFYAPNPPYSAVPGNVVSAPPW